jgi:hypothetical protein
MHIPGKATTVVCMLDPKCTHNFEFTLTVVSLCFSVFHQLIKLAFDEEVTPENIESFRKLVHRVRHPPHILHHFAFTGQVVVPQAPLHKGKEKNATLK